MSDKLDVKIGVNEFGQLGYLVAGEWHWLNINATVNLLDRAYKRIEFGEPLHYRKCNGCGAGIMQKKISADLLTFRYACSCSKSDSETESMYSSIDGDWIPVQKIDSDIIIGQS